MRNKWHCNSVRRSSLFRFISFHSLRLCFAHTAHKNSGECVTLCTVCTSKRDSLLTQNFRSYLAFYYYDCFFMAGWLVCALLIFIINIPQVILHSSHMYVLRSCVRLSFLSFRFFFSVLLLRNMLNQLQSLDLSILFAVRIYRIHRRSVFMCAHAHACSFQ